MRSGRLRRPEAGRRLLLAVVSGARPTAETRDLIAEKGISPTAAALWAAVVSLSDQISEIDRLEKMLKSPQTTG